MSLCEKSTSEGFVVGSFGFDGLFDTVFEAVKIYLPALPCIYWGCYIYWTITSIPSRLTYIILDHTLTFDIIIILDNTVTFDIIIIIR